MEPIVQAFGLLLEVVWIVMIAHIILSWLISFQVLNTRQQQVGLIWYWLNRALEPIYAPIRRLLPATPGLDLAPLVALIAVIFLRRLLGV
jgi:YggT family protein